MSFTLFAFHAYQGELKDQQGSLTELMASLKPPRVRSH